jgi:hypothetical protein
VTRPRAADDFSAIRARLEELRRERGQPAPDDEPPTAAAPRLPATDGAAAPAQRPGLPGWRVAARRRLNSTR